MKIVFVNPPLTQKDLYKGLSEGGSELPPLGIALLAAITRGKGFDTEIVDAQALGLNIDETAKLILNKNPDIVALTSTTVAVHNAADIALKIKEEARSIKTIIGGPHLTAVPSETMERFQQFDVGVVGEGEDAIVELLEGRQPNMVKGVVYRENGCIKTTPRRSFIEDLDRLPYPAWDLLPDLIKYYQPAADSINRHPATLLITSRGCPGQCNFCDRSVFGNRCRAYSARYVIGMIKHLQDRYGIQDFFIEDDNFLVFNHRLREMHSIAKEEKLDLSFSCLGRADMINEESLKLLKEMGCWQINYGCESGSQKILDIINKRITVEQLKKAIDMTHDAGIKVKGLFMLGNFGETKETIKETLDFIKKSKITDFHMSYFTPLPGAEAWELAPRYGTIDRDWRKTNIFSLGNFVPNGFTEKELEYYYKKAYKTFYLRPRIMWYYLKKLKHKGFRKKLVRSGIGFVKFVVR